MHIVFFGDQHLDSLGGAQVSMRLQRRFLEAAGHLVTVVAPRMHGGWTGGGAVSESTVDMPSFAITPDREYSMTWPGTRTDRFVDHAFIGRPPVDLVHVQADFWSAFIGHRFAQRNGIPVVHTMHNRVDVGIAALTPLAGPALAVLNLWRRRTMRGIGDRVHGSDGWAYLRGIVQGSTAVTAPSAHFAQRLERTGVFPTVDVVWNGIDDGLLDATLAARQERPAGKPRFVWVGRMSPEKRLLPFLKAVVASRVDAEVEVIGSGGELHAAQRIARGHQGIRFSGRLAYPHTLARIAAADAVVQTSIGFETQGMTPFEAASLGTPAVVSDPDIAAELRGGLWAVPTPEGTETQRIAALSETLRRAAADISRGAAPRPDLQIAVDFRQSSRTAAMLRIYERVLSSRRAPSSRTV